MTLARQWILIDPLDTLFLKGSEPMVAGENHEVRSVFPPMPSTMRGAIRTAIIQQRGISLMDFTASEPTVVQNYPLLGTWDNPGFEVVGPLFQVQIGGGDTEWLIPAPAHWFAAVPQSTEDGQTVQVTVAERLPDSTGTLGICGSVRDPMWVLNPTDWDMRSLAGYWTNAVTMERVSTGSHSVNIHTSLEKITANEPFVVGLGALFGNEVRVGIALDAGTRRARTGHLYSATHVRLRPGVAMAVGFSEELIPTHLDTEGILQLGGEQRIVRYTLAKKPPLKGGTSAWVMSLSLVPFKALEKFGWDGFHRASGPLTRMGGWDMKMGFHKPMTAYLPAGTVIMVGQDIPLPQGFVRI